METAEPGRSTYSLAFAASVAFVIDRLEGGDRLVEDSGGLTKYGISQRAFPEEDIRNLTRPRAVELYHAHYWVPNCCESMPSGLNLLVFDAAVNMWHPEAALLLQRVVRVPADGIIGPRTLAAARAFTPASELRALYSELRLRTYEDLVRRRPAYTGSLYGWRCRVMRVADEAGARGGR